MPRSPALSPLLSAILTGFACLPPLHYSWHSAWTERPAVLSPAPLLLYLPSCLFLALLLLSLMQGFCGRAGGTPPERVGFGHCWAALRQALRLHVAARAFRSSFLPLVGEGRLQGGFYSITMLFMYTFHFSRLRTARQLCRRRAWRVFTARACLLLFCAGFSLCKARRGLACPCMGDGLAAGGGRLASSCPYLPYLCTHLLHIAPPAGMPSACCSSSQGVAGTGPGALAAFLFPTFPLFSLPACLPFCLMLPFALSLLLPSTLPVCSPTDSSFCLPSPAPVPPSPFCCLRAAGRFPARRELPRRTRRHLAPLPPGWCRAFALRQHGAIVPTTCR